MSGERSVENERSDGVAPQAEEGAAPLLHGGERDEAKGVIGKMGEEIDEQDEPGRETNPRDHAAGLMPLLATVLERKQKQPSRAGHMPYAKDTLRHTNAGPDDRLPYVLLDAELAEMGMW